MMLLAVKFINSDPTTGAFDQLPQEVLSISDASLIPKDGIWVAMTRQELGEYVDKVRQNSELRFLKPVGGHVINFEPINTSSMSTEELNVTKSRIKRLFGVALCAEITDDLSGRNISLNKNGTFVLGMLQDLGVIASLLQSGALSTAYSLIRMYSPKYPEYVDVFEEAKEEIRSFLVSINEW